MSLRPAALLSAGIGAVTAKQLFDVTLHRRWPTTLDLAPLCFYLGASSVVAGRDVDVHVHCPAGATLTVARLDADRRPGPPVVTTELPPTEQTGSYDHWTGFTWPARSVATERAWTPGLYLVELTSGTERYRQALIVSAPEPTDVCVVLSTNTWAAYNHFGGLSNYIDTATPTPLRQLYYLARVADLRVLLGQSRLVPSVPLPFRRPNDRIDEDLATLDADPVADFSHLVRAEWAVLRFLDQTGVAYTVCSDWDLAFGSSPTAARLLIFAAHSEYWSDEMRGRFLSFIGSGGRALFLSGNNWYRTVRHLEHGLEVVEQKVDPRFVARHLGTGYTVDGFATSAPFRVMQPDHPIFAGLDLSTGDVFGGPDERGPGASGHETDKVNIGSGPVDVLAIGCNAVGPAFMTWKDHPGGGWICNASSVTSGPWVERCPILGAVVTNVIDLARS